MISLAIFVRVKVMGWNLINSLDQNSILPWPTMHLRLLVEVSHNNQKVSGRYRQSLPDLWSVVDKYCTAAAVGVYIDNARRQSFIIFPKLWYIQVRPSSLRKSTAATEARFTLNDLFLWTGRSPRNQVGM